MKSFLSIILGLMLCLSSVPVHACVGKTLVVGALDTPQQQVLSQMLAILISERTGTTVKVVPVEGHPQAHDALLRADLDMYIEYTGVGQVVILKAPPIADANELYQAVKDRYNRDMNLIWLKPFGFSDTRYAPEGTIADAAPVVRKDTLKKFPALARLINKLGGAIDAATMSQLEAQTSESGAQEIARQFLKENRFI
jgi:osmoprotectant transport system substrate-binding protein